MLALAADDLHAGFPALVLALVWGLAVALAAVGAGILARSAGHGREGALLAAAGHGLSCAVVLGLGGHLSPGTAWLVALLPWVLVAAERSGTGAAGWERGSWAAIAGGLALVTAARAAAVGPPVALAGLVATLGRGRAAARRHGPAAAAILAGVLLGALRSGLPAGAAAGGHGVDLVALGIGVLAAGIVARWRELAPRLGPRSWVAGAAVTALLLLGALVALAARGLGRPALDLVLPTAGRGDAPWIPAALAVPAVAALFGAGAPESGERVGARRGALGVLALVALALLVRAPGAAGLGATLSGTLWRPEAWLAPATLAVALCAADGVRASGRARVAGAATALALAALAGRGLEAHDRGPIDPPDELVCVLAPDPPRLRPGVRLVGRLSDAVPAVRVRLELRAVDRDGAPTTRRDTRLVDAAWLTGAAAEAARAEHGAAADARLFALAVPRELPGRWEAWLLVEGAGPVRLGERSLGRFGSDATLLPWVLAALALCVPRRRPRVALLVLLVALQQGARSLILWPS